jgi:hypothetical protein
MMLVYPSGSHHSLGRFVGDCKIANPIRSTCAVGLWIQVPTDILGSLVLFNRRDDLQSSSIAADTGNEP